MRDDPVVVQASHDMVALLPRNKDAAILDIGFGEGWFIAACLRLGYTNVAGADFGIANNQHLKEWSPAVVCLEEIQTNIGDFLADRHEQYDFIHMSHVIEHIPKYSLLYVVDALYQALRRGGMLLLRAPNMEGPCANSCHYVTLTHEYGFTGSNLTSLLSICNFDDIEFQQFKIHRPTPKQTLGRLIRWPIVTVRAFKHRLFGVNFGGQFGTELVMTAKRGNLPPHFDQKFK